jgi:acetyl-CoA acetyltransferase
MGEHPVLPPMRRVAVVAFACDVWPLGDGRNDAELLAPVVDRALAAAGGIAPGDIGVLGTASSEFLNGAVGSVMGAFDALPGWPPRVHSHLEADGAWALYESWVRLLAGEAEAALVCAFSRSLAADPRDVLVLQLDPYVVAPLAPAATSMAALQARALLEAARYGEADFAAVASARRPGVSAADVLRQPYIASPLRAADCSTPCAGAAAIVLAADDLAEDATEHPAWISGVEHRIESHALGGRDLTLSRSTRAAAARLGLPGSAIDVLEVHAPFSHQELIVVDAVGAGDIGALNPSGGALPADPMMVTGLIRIGSAAEAILRGEARRAVGHATNGPCLQHNLLCLLEAGR